MTQERKAPERHPSTAIAPDVVSEISYLVYLRRLEPPLTPEQSLAKILRDNRGEIVSSDDMRRVRASFYDPLTREYLRALVDLGMIVP